MRNRVPRQPPTGSVVGSQAPLGCPPPGDYFVRRDSDTRAVRLLVPGEAQVDAADQSCPRLEPWASPLCPGTPRGG